MIKKIHIHPLILSINLLLMSACSSTPTTGSVTGLSDKHETLTVYEDGRMEFQSKFVNHNDVVIYADGRGGERAAIKVRVPIHPDFYRDSIPVVRVVSKFDESISQNKSEEVDNLN